MTTTPTPTPEDDVKPIRDALAAGPTPGPYQVVVTEHPHHRGNCHIERRIFTAWDHPQMKGPIGIVNGAVGIGATEGGPAHRFTAIEAADAEWFATCYPERIARLLARLEQAERIVAVAYQAMGQIIGDGGLTLALNETRLYDWLSGEELLDPIASMVVSISPDDDAHIAAIASEAKT